MNKKTVFSIVIILVLFLFLSNRVKGQENSGNSAEPRQSSVITGIAPAMTFSPIDPMHGSAVRLEGRIVLVSIFANDTTTRWNYDSDADLQLLNWYFHCLTKATAYLSDQAARYGSQASFIYDWTYDAALSCSAFFDQDLVRDDGDMYMLQSQWIAEHIDISALMERYGADSIHFLFLFNTDYSNPVKSWTLDHTNSDAIHLELSNFYLKFNNFDFSPAICAHEILHAFGAHDLYYAGTIINQDYVDHLASVGSRDIMYAVSTDSEITEQFTDLDAYYVGIAPPPEEVILWKLGASEHDIKSLMASVPG